MLQIIHFGYNLYWQKSRSIEENELMTYINYSNVWLQTHFMSLTDNTCELKTGTNVKKCLLENSRKFCILNHSSNSKIFEFFRRNYWIFEYFFFENSQLYPITYVAKFWLKNCAHVYLNEECLKDLYQNTYEAIKYAQGCLVIK